MKDMPWMIHAVGGLVCAGLLAAAYWLGAEPLAESAVSEQELQDQVRDAEADLRMHTAELERLSGQARIVRTQIQDRPMELQPASSVNARLARLSELAAACQLDLGVTRVGEPQRSGEHRYIAVELGGMGSMAGVGQLLTALHRDLPDLSVQSMELTRDPAEGIARFNLKLVWFVSEGIGQSAGVPTR